MLRRFIVGFGIVVMLSGTAMAEGFFKKLFQSPQDRAAEAAFAEVGEAVDDCKRKYNEGVIKTKVASIGCQNAAIDKISALDPYPDISRWAAAISLLIATKVDAGELTATEAEAEFARISMEAQSERQRRHAGERPIVMPSPMPSPPRHLNCYSTDLGYTITTNCY